MYTLLSDISPGVLSMIVLIGASAESINVTQT